MIESSNTRQWNQLMILRAIDTAGEATAGMIAEMTGLSVATISRGLSTMKAKKLILQKRKETAELGRRPDVFAINGGYTHCLYFCLEGASLRGYLLDLTGKLIARDGVEATADMDIPEFLQKLRDMQALLESRKRSTGCILAVSLAIPGVADAVSGNIIRIPNFPHFENVNLAALVRDALGHPCFIHNASRLSALGAYLQSGEQIESLVYMDITTDCGIGAGIILGGALYEDRNSCAGEVGDMVVHAHTEGRRRGGNQGALEQEAGLGSVFREARELLDQGLAPGLQKQLDKQGSEVLSLSVLEKAAADLDLEIYELLNKTTRAWAAAIVNISALLSPDVIILGGGVHQGHRLMEKMLRHHLSRLYHQPVSLQLAKKGADTHVAGAAHLSRRFLFDMAIEDIQD